MYKIEGYQSTHSEEWDRFVIEESVNGTVFQTRSFLGYHPPARFEDASILVRHGGELVAVVPACKVDTGYFSHSGTSYGGPVIDPEHYRMRRLEPLLESILEHYSGNLGMRLAPSIFSPARDDALVFLLGRRLSVRRELGIFRSLHVGSDILESIPSERKRTAIRQLTEQQFEVRKANSVREYVDFHAMLAENLARHDVRPTHAIEELLELRERLGERQALFIGYEEDGDPTSATWVVKATSLAWHAFYIAKSYERGHSAAVPALLVHVMRIAVDAGASYLNLGVCTEDMGRILNRGLFNFKESIGGIPIIRRTFLPS